MSGLLRRIKRSRTADAGEVPAEGPAAAPDGAPGAAATAAGDPATAHVPAAAIAADPDRPAGLDAGAAPLPPTGRRARLRRRLRYLRRAREVLLRDIGGLVYEVHRTAGGDLAAHGGVIGAQVGRLRTLDAEAAAIEAALAVEREETVLFQPGVGGTCDFCGELYGSSARFCSNCGSPTGSAVRATPAPLAERARPVPPLPKPPQTPAPAPAEPAAAGEQPTRELAPDQPEEQAAETAAEEQPEEQPAEEQPAEEQPAEERPAEERPAEERPAEAPAPAPDPARNPFSGIGNGRAEDDVPPDLSAGDPLARESRK
jgi:hypothetical protein